MEKISSFFKDWSSAFYHERNTIRLAVELVRVSSVPAGLPLRPTGHSYLKMAQSLRSQDLTFMFLNNCKTVAYNGFVS